MARGPKLSSVVEELQNNDAFELREDAAESFRKPADGGVFRKDRIELRRRILVVVVAIVVLAACSCCIGSDGAGTGTVRFYSPLDVCTVVVTSMQLFFMQLVDPLSSYDAPAIANATYGYIDIRARIGTTLITIVCGGLLAVSGMLFQNTFKNPMASPTILGVGNGVQVGEIVLLLQYGYAAAQANTERMVYCYVGGAAVLLAVIFLGKVIGGKRGFNVYDMLMVGVIVSTLVGAVLSYANVVIVNSGLQFAQIELSNRLNVHTDIVSLVVLAVATVVSLVPVLMLRFSMNALSYSDEDVRLCGVSPNVLRVVALVGGSLMVLTAEIFVGAVSVLTLVIPFFTRYLFGMEFRKQLWGNLLVGMLVLLICRDISALIPFVGYGVPLGTIASIITLPLFVWMITLSKRTWE